MDGPLTMMIISSMLLLLPLKLLPPTLPLLHHSLIHTHMDIHMHGAPPYDSYSDPPPYGSPSLISPLFGAPPPICCPSFV